ncbi:MAG: prepilin-type N-terminal cleavage/methylation domain-containing protein [Phycisphaeraceae bacterium]|nr:prepilin-type N-terminal cleavage/methylation domain-containing protein [Phycisphaeraceae bacterium]
MRNRSGFTLIEILLATILTAVLMVGVLAVIVSVSGPIQHSDEPGPSTIGQVDLDAITRVLAADLAQARRIETDGGELKLMSYGGLDPQDRSRTQRPVNIDYRVQWAGEAPWLVRTEQALDGQAVMARHDELVAPGVTRIALDPPADQPPRITRTGSGHRILEEPIVLPADGLWRLRLWGQGRRDPIIDRPVVIRRSLAQ